MKTIYIPLQKIYLFSSFVIITLFLNSCGSYHTSSYYDSDGIYEKSENQKRVTPRPHEKIDDNQYKNYFGSLQETPKKDSTFTDVESYNSNSYTESEKNNNVSWGSDSGTTIINVYDSNWGWNNYWNWNIGWGWNSWYGPNYGWGWNPWYENGFGWGWNSWYGNNWCGGHYQPYYQGTRSYAYNNGSFYNNNQNSSSGRRYNNAGTRTSNTDFAGTRNTIRTRNPNTTTRINPIRNSSNINSTYYNSTTRINNNTSIRTRTSPTRSNYNSAPVRSNSSNYGSGNNSGNYGGSRSSGGRR